MDSSVIEFDVLATEPTGNEFIEARLDLNPAKTDDLADRQSDSSSFDTSDQSPLKPSKATARKVIIVKMTLAANDPTQKVAVQSDRRPRKRKK